MKALDLVGVGLAAAAALGYMGFRLARTLGARNKAAPGAARAGACASCPVAKGRGGLGGGCPGCGQ